MESKGNTELIKDERRKRWRKKYNIARTQQQEEKGAGRTGTEEERDVLSPGCQAEHNLFLLAL